LKTALEGRLSKLEAGRLARGADASTCSRLHRVSQFQAEDEQLRRVVAKQHKQTQRQISEIQTQLHSLDKRLSECDCYDGPCDGSLADSLFNLVQRKCERQFSRGEFHLAVTRGLISVGPPLSPVSRGMDVALPANVRQAKESDLLNSPRKAKALRTVPVIAATAGAALVPLADTTPSTKAMLKSQGGDRVGTLSTSPRRVIHYAEVPDTPPRLAAAARPALHRGLTPLVRTSYAEVPGTPRRLAARARRALHRGLTPPVRTSYAEVPDTPPRLAAAAQRALTPLVRTSIKTIPILTAQGGIQRTATGISTAGSRTFSP